LTTSPEPNGAAAAPRRATARFMRGHLARWIALGFGSGLAPRAPGTVGTLWAWVSFLVLDRWLDATGWALLIGVSLLLGTWACTRCAQQLGTADPGAIVWDEIVAFWIVLWLVMPAPWWLQLLAFALFRFFDAAKPGPVAWADALFKTRGDGRIGWRQGFGIVFDDLVAALCTMLVLALWVLLMRALWSS
jgi:phosphatidylglycerophosphatase A